MSNLWTIETYYFQLVWLLLRYFFNNNSLFLQNKLWQPCVYPGGQPQKYFQALGSCLNVCIASADNSMVAVFLHESHWKFGSEAQDPSFQNGIDKNMKKLAKLEISSVSLFSKRKSQRGQFSQIDLDGTGMKMYWSARSHVFHKIKKVFHRSKCMPKQVKGWADLCSGYSRRYKGENS